jgi:predicted protein tyrosine phosphatase
MSPIQIDDISLRIDTAERALALLEEGWPTRALSLVGDDLRFPLPCFGPHHLILRFHDVETDSLPGFNPPDEQHVRAALEHMRGIGAGDRLLVHCHAGKSRSPAMAIGILVQGGLRPLAAFEEVRRIRPELIPNRLIIRHVDHLLGLGGELAGIVAAHYESLGPEAALPNRGGLNL